MRVHRKKRSHRLSREALIEMMECGRKAGHQFTIGEVCEVRDEWGDVRRFVLFPEGWTKIEYAMWYPKHS